MGAKTLDITRSIPKARERRPGGELEGEACLAWNRDSLQVC